MGNIAANPLAGLIAGPDPTSVPSPGTDGWHALVPTAEPVSGGACPVAPALVRRLTAQLDSRIVRARSNHVVTAALATAVRPTLEAAWSVVATTERDLVVDFLSASLANGRDAFTIELDGPGSSAVKVRAISWSAVQTPKGTHEVTAQLEEVY